jgi:hypothetical protein
MWVWRCPVVARAGLRARHPILGSRDLSMCSVHHAVSLPLPSRNTGDVQTEHRQGADHDHTSDCIDPRPDVRSEDDCQRSRPEVER